MARAHLAKLCAVIVLLLSVSFPAHALITFKQPSWIDLSAEQKVILSPLADEWNAMEDQSKKKWLGIAQRFSSMTPNEKNRIQNRMKEWARLSPQERKLARDSFTSIQKAPQEYRSDMKETIKQQWQQYLELPESEKERLRNESARKTVTTPRSSASTSPGH
jgi:hypothetical protein